MIVGPLSSVVVRLAELAPPGWNSTTAATTLSASPTATDGAEPVKTKMPSDVAVLASGDGSCR